MNIQNPLKRKVDWADALKEKQAELARLKAQLPALEAQYQALLGPDDNDAEALKAKKAVTETKDLISFIGDKINVIKTKLSDEQKEAAAAALMNRHEEGVKLDGDRVARAHRVHKLLKELSSELSEMERIDSLIDQINSDLSVGGRKDLRIAHPIARLGQKLGRPTGYNIHTARFDGYWPLSSITQDGIDQNALALVEKL